MSSRIKVNSIISTEAWRFDKSAPFYKDRWSYKWLGEKWRDSQVIGSVLSKSLDKWMVLWDLDGETSDFETSYLLKEDDNTPKQTGMFERD